jgi:uncharacterized membrane protein
VTHNSTDERTVHRLEAFSDIVIGFSLAQLGAALTIPKAGGVLFADPTWLLTFLLPFATICAMWFFHHRLFASIFVPRTVPMIINFAWLAVVVLCAFTTQLVVRMPGDIGVWRSYYGLFFIAYGMLALQYAICLRLGGARLSPQALLTARRQTAFMTLWTIPFLLCSVFVDVLPPTSWHIAISIVFVLAAVASGVMGRRYRKAQERLEAEGH